jgi:hypothetical protein
VRYWGTKVFVLFWGVDDFQPPAGQVSPYESLSLWKSRESSGRRPHPCHVPTNVPMMWSSMGWSNLLSLCNKDVVACRVGQVSPHQSISSGGNVRQECQGRARNTLPSTYLRRFR